MPKSYPEVVKERAKEVALKIGEADELDLDTAISIIYEALKLTALEGYKDGLKAGQFEKDETCAMCQEGDTEHEH